MHFFLVATIFIMCDVTKKVRQYHPEFFFLILLLKSQKLKIWQNYNLSEFNFVWLMAQNGPKDHTWEA